MLYLLFGEDTYRAKRKLDEIVKKYAATHGSAGQIHRLDCAEIKADQLTRELAARSLFSEKKLLIVKNLFANGALCEALERQNGLLWREDPSLLVVFFEEGEGRPASRLWADLSARAKAQEFHILHGEKLIAWIREECAERGADIEREASSLMAASYGDDSWTLSREIARAIAFAGGPHPLVTKEIARKFCRRQLAVNIFSTIDALASRDKSAALELLQGHLAQGDSPFSLLSAFARQTRNLLLVKSMKEQGLPPASIARESGLHAFVVKKCLAAQEAFSLKDIRAAYMRMCQLDRWIKTGAIEAHAALHQFVVQFP